MTTTTSGCLIPIFVLLLCASFWIVPNEARQRHRINHRNKGNEVCDSLTTARSMFMIGAKVYLKIGTGKLISYDVDTKKHTEEDASRLTKGEMSDIENACHFDVSENCEPDTSNLDFCKNSKVYENMVAITGIDQTNEKFQFYRNSAKGGMLKEYETKEFKSHENSMILPSSSSRLYSALFMLFQLVMSNNHLKFTGATYNQYTDGLFLMATVRDDTVAHSASWPYGKHVLMVSNFSMVGLYHDSVVVHKFAEEMAGLIDYSGHLFALTNKGDKVIELDEMLNEVHTYDLKSFIGCGDETNSPFSKKSPVVKPLRISLSDLGIGRINSLAFPFFGEEVRVVESSMLTGFNFVAIITVLVVLLVLIVVVDAFIIYNMTKPEPGTVAIQSGPISSRKGSSASTVVLVRSKSKSGSSKSKSRGSQTSNSKF